MYTSPMTACPLSEHSIKREKLGAHSVTLTNRREKLLHNDYTAVRVLEFGAASKIRVSCKSLQLTTTA